MLTWNGLRRSTQDGTTATGISGKSIGGLQTRGLARSLLPSAPALCRVCQMPCVFPTYENNARRVTIYQGKKHAFCSAACEYIFHEDPQRYLGYPTLYELYQGKSLGEFIRSNK